MATTRKVIDCRWFPTEKPCDIAISGNEEEVLNIAVQHAVQSHGTQKYARIAAPVALNASRCREGSGCVKPTFPDTLGISEPLVRSGSDRGQSTNARGRCVHRHCSNAQCAGPAPDVQPSSAGSGTCFCLRHRAERPAHRKNRWRDDPRADQTMLEERVGNSRSRRHFSEPGRECNFHPL